MKKYSLINEKGVFEEGDTIVFDMPPFCSGDYKATIYVHPIYGPYINKENDYFKGCRDYRIIKK